MIFAVEFTDDIDPTALATVALAVLTFVTVVVGGLALRKTQSEIDLSRSEVEEAHRPVLIPLLDEAKLIQTGSHGAVPARPTFMPTSHVLLPLTNIGSGPALKVDLTITPRGDAAPFRALVEDVTGGGMLVGIGVSDITVVTLRLAGVTEVPDFDLLMTYSDVAGKQWATKAKYAREGDGRYQDISISTVERAPTGMGRMRKLERKVPLLRAWDDAGQGSRAGTPPEP